MVRGRACRQLSQTVAAVVPNHPGAVPPEPPNEVISFDPDIAPRCRHNGEAMRPCRRVVPGLFAGLDFGFLHRGLRATRSAFGSAEPNRRQILVGVVARADP